MFEMERLHKYPNLPLLTRSIPFVLAINFQDCPNGHYHKLPQTAQNATTATMPLYHYATICHYTTFATSATELPRGEPGGADDALKGASPSRTGLRSSGEADPGRASREQVVCSPLATIVSIAI